MRSSHCTDEDQKTHSEEWVFFIRMLVKGRYSFFNDAISMENRYFTSDFSIRSYASLICWIGMISTSEVMPCSPQKSNIS